MGDEPSILVLHGITMCGASMLRTLGPLGKRLEALGFSLIAPNGGHRMSPAEVNELVTWVGRFYTKFKQSVGDAFSDTRFWDAGEHYDWLSSATDSASGKKTYHALEASLDAIGAAVRGRRIAGVIGFSQGAAMAIALADRAQRGDARFSGLGWGVFISGFKPVFDEPAPVTYPIGGAFPSLFVIGERDPIFPGTREYLTSMSEAFDGRARELLLVPGLGHDVPSSEEHVEQIVEFVVKGRPGS